MASRITRTYDAILLGSGQASTPLSQALAKSGRHTALVEARHIGGTCVNEGCTPTKTMVASARAAWVTSTAKRMGVILAADAAGGPSSSSWKMDMQTVRKRKRDIVDSFRGGSEKRIAATEGLEVYMGKGRFVGEKEVEVEVKNESGTGQETVVLKAKEIFINVGCRPTKLDIPGVDQVEVLDSTSIMELDVVPEHLIVVGGGYVGLEFGQMFRRFGAKVTIIQRSDHLLGQEDPDVAEEVQKVMTEDGITILLNSTPISVEKNASGKISMTIQTLNSKDTVTVQGSHLLAAAGRTPNTDYLSPAKSGIEVNNKGFIQVSPTLETNVPGIFVLGDAKGGPAFTHISYDDFRIIRTNFIEKSANTASTTNRLIPYTMYTDPQYGRVGHSETSALAAYGNDRSKIQVAKMPMQYVARALEIDETRGFMKAVVEKDSGKIIGFMCIGAEGGEIMSMVQIAMMGGVKWWQLRDAVFAHPTFAESLNNLWGFLE